MDWHTGTNVLKEQTASILTHRKPRSRNFHRPWTNHFP